MYSIVLYIATTIWDYVRKSVQKTLAFSSNSKPTHQKKKNNHPKKTKPQNRSSSLQNQPAKKKKTVKKTVPRRPFDSSRYPGCLHTRHPQHRRNWGRFQNSLSRSLVKVYITYVGPVGFFVVGYISPLKKPGVGWARCFVVQTCLATPFLQTDQKFGKISLHFGGGAWSFLKR